MTKWCDIMVYGSFDDPDTKKNFFLVRMPAGRVPWITKIVPAIDRVVQSMFTEEQLRQNRERKRMRHEPLVWWKCEGHDEDIWGLKQPVTRYEWDGKSLAKLGNASI